MSTALYNRYRPATFSQVVGQDHVTGALARALTSGRLHHAYLFSGPRGCGKTSSARILAASLNCENGPTPEPCGVCEQCVTIRAGSSMDVIEIDAASHGLVDDARDLRERAAFAPASARFKVYVVDEAHMVTAAAFNALLKVVEEPPPYLKFVFATTEPDKVIATIRSRTHHYSFRLVPPGVLRDHLASVCAQENVKVDPAVLPLVVRAGAGSVRDSLSVLDQLLAGADDSGLDYDRAVALLGMTDGVLLDDTVDALAARDGATVFAVVDRMVSGGHDPRRFATDLLERMRDLIVLAAVPDAADRGLLDTYSADQLDRMRAQAGRMGPAELSRTADVLHAGLVEMRGTASPRLVLELVLARAMLPGAAQDTSSLLVRLERLERGLPAVAPAHESRGPSRNDAADVPAADVPAAAERAVVREPAPVRQAAPTAAAPSHTPPASPAPTEPAAPSTAPRPSATPSPAPPGAPAAPAGPAAPAAHPAAAAVAVAAAVPQRSPAADGRLTPDGLRASWDAVLLEARRRKPATHALLQEYAAVADVRGDEVVLTFSVPTIARMFSQGTNVEVLCAALTERFGGSWRVTIEGPTGPGQSAGGSSRRPSPTSGPGPGPGSGGPGPSGGPNPAQAFGPGQPAAPRAGQHPAPGGGSYPSRPAGSGGPATASVVAPSPSPVPAPASRLFPATAPGAPSAGTSAGGTSPGGTSAAASSPVSLSPGAAVPPPHGQASASMSHAGATSATSTASTDGATRQPPPPARGAMSHSVGSVGAGRPSPVAPARLVGGSTAVVTGPDEPSMDDDDVPADPGASLPGDEAAVALLRSSFGAVVIESPGE